MTAASVAEDVDEIAVERAMHGDLIPLSATEVQTVFERLLSRGENDQRIGAALGVSHDLVCKWRRGERRFHALRKTVEANPVVDDATDELLCEAAEHPSAQVRDWARKASQALTRLRELLIEDQEQAKTRAEVERLERALSEAKAKLRGRSSGAVAKRRQTVTPAQLAACRANAERARAAKAAKNAQQAVFG